MNYQERLDLVVRVLVTAELAERADELVRSLVRPAYSSAERQLVARAATTRAAILAHRAQEALAALNAAIERTGGKRTHTLEWIGCDEQTFRRAVEAALDHEAP
jgi:hypothetical protein